MTAKYVSWILLTSPSVVDLDAREAANRISSLKLEDIERIRHKSEQPAPLVQSVPQPVSQPPALPQQQPVRPPDLQPSIGLTIVPTQGNISILVTEGYTRESAIEALKKSQNDIVDARRYLVCQKCNFS